jgi:hypothetical protein
MKKYLQTSLSTDFIMTESTKNTCSREKETKFISHKHIFHGHYHEPIDLHFQYIDACDRLVLHHHHDERQVQQQRQKQEQTRE